MSALVERIIATRDRLKPLMRQGEDYIWRPAKDAVEALADAANALTERDETIFHLRNQLAAAKQGA